MLSYISGAPDRIRTCGLCLRRAALYPAELRVPGARILIVSSARNIGKMSAGWINRGGEHALVEQLVTQFKRIN